MTYICGYCGGTRRGRPSPPRRFPTWEDLIDHLVNAHRFMVQQGRLVRR